MRAALVGEEKCVWFKQTGHDGWSRFDEEFHCVSRMFIVSFFSFTNDSGHNPNTQRRCKIQLKVQQWTRAVLGPDPATFCSLDWKCNSCYTDHVSYSGGSEFR